MRQEIRAKLEAWAKKGTSEPFPGKGDYSLAGLQGIPKYVKDYSTLFTFGETGNLAVTYLGSYVLRYRVTNIDIKKGVANVHFWVYNESKASSGSRPPVLGYTNWWNRRVGKGLDSSRQSGPMSKTTQKFDWDETIHFKGIGDSGKKGTAQGGR